MYSARFIAGFGHGGLVSISFASVGLSTKTDRNLGIHLTVLLSYGAAGLLAIPMLLNTIGMSGLFLFFAGVAICGLACLPWLPSGPKGETAPQEVSEPINWKLLRPFLLGFLAWNKVLPFSLAAIADFDPRGRIMSFALAIQLSGLAIGPYQASQVVGNGDYFKMELMGVIFFIVGYILLIMPVMAHSLAFKNQEHRVEAHQLSLHVANIRIQNKLAK